MLSSYLIVTFLGLVLGSFTTALVYRVPRGVSWAFQEKGESSAAPRSTCPHCKTQLQAADLIPLFSWILLRGKCRFCKEKISPAYPAIELGSVVSALLIYSMLGWSSAAIFLLAALPFLIALFVIDLQHMILPNELVFIVGLIGFAKHVTESFYFNTLKIEEIATIYLSAALFYGGLSWFLGWLMERILKKEALGGGDIKFFAVSGLWLGIHNISAFCIAAGFLGVVLALLCRRISKEDVFPFGPALILSFYGILLVDGSFLG